MKVLPLNVQSLITPFVDVNEEVVTKALSPFAITLQSSIDQLEWAAAEIAIPATSAFGLGLSKPVTVIPFIFQPSNATFIT